MTSLRKSGKSEYDWALNEINNKLITVNFVRCDNDIVVKTYIFIHIPYE